MKAKSLMLLAMGLSLAGAMPAGVPKRPGVPPDHAWHMLVLGNDRFASGLTLGPHRDQDTRRRLLLGERPWAVVVTDSDSRVAPELIFDLGLGDLYTVRTAAEALGGPALDSVAYAVEHLGPRLVVVLGHTHDAVVQAALDGRAGRLGAEKRLAGNLAPAMEEARSPIAGLSGMELAASAVEHNVLLQMERVLKDPSVGQAVRDGRVKVVGGVYSLDTGRIHWLGQDPQQAQILAGKRP